MVDLSGYGGGKFLKFEDVCSGSRSEKIVGVKIGSYDRPEVTFESGDMFSLNKTNTKKLLQTFGKDSRDWIGCVIELYPGKTVYKGQTSDSVLVRPDPTAAKDK